MPGLSLAGFDRVSKRFLAFKDKEGTVFSTGSKGFGGSLNLDQKIGGKCKNSF